ncbi:MAG: YncE family protein, partial [Deltaproteobacteria bacterium]|nr:YncE family protein [Deltaproteobacteria bacterium]
MQQGLVRIALAAATAALLGHCSSESAPAKTAAADAAAETSQDSQVAGLADTASATGAPADATAADEAAAADDSTAAPDAPVDTFGVYPKQVAEALPTVPPRFAIPTSAPAAEWKGAPPGQKVYVLPNGRWLTPAGEEIFLGDFPQGLTLHPSGKVAYVANGGHAKAIQVVDLASKKIIQTVKKPFIYRWLSISADGKFLYASGGPRQSAWRMEIDADGKLGKDFEYTTDRGFFGIAASPDGKYLYGLVDLAKGSDDKLHPQLWRMNTATGEHDATAQLGDAPYDLVVAPDGKTAFSVGWRGGRVQRIDLGSMAAPGDEQTVKLGWNGQGIALSPNGQTVYATAVEGDLLVAIDAKTLAKVAEIPLNFAKVAGMAPQGRDPGFVRVSPDGKRIYVVCAMSNEVIVVDAASKAVVGTIPTGWYPSALAISADNKTLYVVNAKGNGYPPGPWTKSGATDGYMGT